MTLESILASMLVVYGPLMSMATVPQIVRILRRKSSKDISILSYAITVPGFALWLAYGVVKGDLPLMVANSVGMVTSVIVLSLSVIYRNGASIVSSFQAPKGRIRQASR